MALSIYYLALNTKQLVTTTTLQTLIILITTTTSYLALSIKMASVINSAEKIDFSVD